MAEPSLNQVAEAVKAFIEAQTWEECRYIVEIQRDKLLTDTADLFLAHMLEQCRNDVNATLLFEDHRDLLARCRRDGVDAAFAVYFHTDKLLKPLLNEIEQLSSPKDLPRRVELCRTALELMDRDAQPQQWTKLQIQLANSLVQNPLGERADNLEQAIHHYRQVLEIYTQQNFPAQWAMIQHNLGIASNERIRGERADNLEQAIHHFEQALQVRTRQAFPAQWASTENSLANAFSERIRGERADNLEQAIHYYQQALQVYTRQAFPEDWAMTQHNLAIAYDDRIRGERADNL